MYALWQNPFLSTCILSDGNVYCMHPLGDIELLNRKKLRCKESYQSTDAHKEMIDLFLVCFYILHR